VNDQAHVGSRRILATFTPRCLDTLRPELRPLIGETVEWWCGGVSGKDEPYPGQRRWHTNDPRFDGYWSPDEDLTPA
jgi:hypothetical protein